MSEKHEFYFEGEIEKAKKIQGRTHIEIMPERAAEMLSSCTRKEDALGLLELLGTNFDWMKLCRSEEVRNLIEYAIEMFSDKLNKNKLPPGDPNRIALTEGQFDECSSVLVLLRTCKNRCFPRAAIEA